MAESIVIREFLVALGYKTDETAMKKFTGGIAAATKSVFVLGTVIEATAIAVATGVARFASNLEQLYFAAQRTNSSANSLKAFDLAARNFGASIDEAQGSVESLAAFLRNNPGGANIISGWLGSVGLSARNAATGAQLTGTALMAQIGQMFRVMREQGRTFQANQVAGMLGISDRTMLAISAPGFEEEMARQEKRAAGWQRVSEAAHRFMIQLEDLKMQFFQMMLGFEGPAMAALQGLMPKLSKLIRDHGKQIVTDLGLIFTFLIEGIGRLVDWLDTHGKEIIVRLEALFLDLNFNFTMYIKPVFSWLYDKIVELDKATDGWSTKIGLVLIGLKAIGATGIVTGIASIAAGLAKAATGLVAAGAAEGAGAWALAGSAFGVAAWGAIGYGLGTLMYKIMPESWQRRIGDTIGGAIDWAKNLGDPAANAQRNADPSNWSESHYPWDKPPAGGFSSKIELNLTVSASGQPETIAKHIAAETEAAIKRANADMIREFNARVQ